MEDRKRMDRTLVCCILSVCLTSGMSGVAGEVTDGVVLTDLHKTVKRGNDVVLNCEFYKEPVAVYWKKGNDPKGGVDVVTWVDGREFSGYCVNNERCGMGTTNYSLIIRDARIADRGRYICRVSNYLGVLIHNFTDLKIYAPPDEPYPTIDECQTKGGSVSSGTSPEDCRILTNSTVVNITCSAFGFFPDVNLFFLHGTSKVINIGSNGWGNEDRSKSKSITINARVSDKQYVCVASDVPGSTEERTAGVYVESYFPSPQNSDNASRPFEETTANPNEADGRSGSNPAKIVVPILLILVVATAGVVFFWWRSRKQLARSHIGKRDVEESELLVQKVKVQGVVSFYELWLLAYETPNGEMSKVYTALVKLGITNVKGQMDKGLVYDALCEWKESSSARDQPQMLRDALEEVGLETRWQDIFDKVRHVNYSTKVPEGTFEQILHDLKGKKAIKKFLCILFQRESIVTETKTIGVTHDNEEDEEMSAIEEDKVGMEKENKEKSASAKEISDTHDGEKNKEKSASAKEISDTDDREENKEKSASAKEISDTHDGENKEKSASAKEISDTHDGEKNKEKSASAKKISDTDDREKNKERSASAKEISDNHDGEKNKEKSASAKEISDNHDGEKNKENSASAKEISDTDDREESKEKSASAKEINDTDNREENKEKSTSAKEISDTLDGEKNKEKSASANENMKEEVIQTRESAEYMEAMRKLKEWNKDPFKQNPFVLVSLALERAGYRHISKTFFDGPVSFYELRTLMFNVKTPSLEKLRKTICKLGIDERRANNFGPQQIYDYLCQWKDGHPQVDQGKLLHDALLRAGHEEAWSIVLEQRKDKSDVCESTFKKILRNVTDPAVIQQLLKRLDPDEAKDLDTSLETDFMQKAMGALKEWNERSHDENRMILLSRALEKAKCKPIDRTFLSETMSFFELWSVGHFDFETGVITLPIREALKSMGILGIEETIGQHELYHLLCKWKEEHSNCDQRLVFKVHLLNEGLHKEWQNLSDLRFGTDRIISNDTLEHILWHLKTPRKINDFLHKLTNTDQESIPEDSNLPEGIRIALTRLELWKKGPINIHPVILLSEALESAKCSNVAITFFQVPVHLQKPIGDQEVSEFVRRLTSRHRERLANQTSPVTEDKKIFNFAEENNDMLFDANSLVRDWIEREQCCNYEKRCKLDDMLIKIGRHDMADFFATVRFRRNTDPELSAKLYPESQVFHLTTIFDDDLVLLRMLMACLDEEMMKEFCKKVGIPRDVVGPNKQRPDHVDLRRWRDNHLQYTVKVVFSEITGFMTNKTKVNFVTDEELDWLAFQVTTDGKVEKCAGKRSKKFAKKLRATHSLLPDERDGESQPKLERLHSQEGHEGAVAETVGSHKDSQEEDAPSAALLQQVKFWRNKHKEKKCRKSLRSALKHVGLEECIVNKTPREKVYEVEIVRAAFHILMKDVYPVIEALGINQKTISKYMRRPVLDKGSVDLLFQICKGTDSYNRLDFCVKLTNMGYVDVARSIYLDHEMSLSELASIASELHRRDQTKFEPLIHELDLRSGELPEDHGAQFETHCLEVLRTWKEKIGPVPYHYRRHIVEALQAVGCSDLADEVLTGLYRHEYPDEEVIEDICSMLDDTQIRNLLEILKLKPDHEEQDRKKINKMIVRWAGKWMRKYVSSAISFKERRSLNDELVREGFYELAHEIMILEYSKF